MSEYIDVLGIHLMCPNVSEALELVGGYLQNNSLNTIGVITMQVLLKAQEQPEWKQCVENYDLPIIVEPEVLQAAGIASGQILEQIHSNEFGTRIAWNLINRNCRFFLLGETESDTEQLKKDLRESFPDILIAGSAFGPDGEYTANDRIVNLINGTSVDVVICNLPGPDQVKFLSENRQKINGSIWIALDENFPEKDDSAGKKNRLGSFLKKSAFLHLAEKFRS